MDQKDNWSSVRVSEKGRCFTWLRCETEEEEEEERTKDG